jgi:hypothetical protein
MGCFALGARYSPGGNFFKTIDIDFQQFWENEVYPDFLSGDPEKTKSYDDRTRFDLAVDTKFGLHGGFGVYTLGGDWRPVADIGFRFGFDWDSLVPGLRLEFDPGIAYLDKSIKIIDEQIEGRLTLAVLVDEVDRFCLRAKIIDQNHLSFELQIPLSGSFLSGVQILAGFSRTEHQYVDGNAALVGDDLKQHYYVPRWQNLVDQQIWVGISTSF